ncbi:S8 family peptidase [Luteococcus peritonei]|uniref:S8 family peptidase n=1 Tax=Luteococcus peritonei TaxID=88874 RepID=A0ABW4RUR1_9ACTN
MHIRTTLTVVAVAGTVAAIGLATPAQAQGLGPQDWGLDRIDARSGLDGSFTSTLTGQGVTIYVVGSGVMAEHADLRGRVRAGMTAMDDGNGTGDCADHDTHVAGIAAGTGHGVAKGATVVPVRVLGCDFSGGDAQLVKGLRWMIADHQAGTPAVANLSIAYPVSTATQLSAVEDAVDDAIADGITVVVSAGNESMSAGEEYPGRLPNVITVASSTVSETMAWDSSYGSGVDLVAPGYNILSATNDGSFGVKSGTSMAAPFVSGAAALALQAHPGWSPVQVQSFLVQQATVGAIRGISHDTPNRLLYTGWSRETTGTVPTTVAPAPAPTTATPAPTTTAPAPSTTAPAPTTAAPKPTTAAPAPAPTSSAPGSFRMAWMPQVKGTPRVGSAVASDRGGWVPGASSTAMRWYRLVGTRRTLVGSSAGYTAQPADLGARLQLCVTGSRAGFASRTSCSVASAVVAPGNLSLSATPTIGGRPVVGNLVNAVPRIWGPAPVTLRYQWYRVNSRGTATAISGATGARYRSTTADLGHRMRVRVTGSRPGYTTRVAWSVLSVPIHR